MTDQKQVSIFLDDLRESGVCNMWEGGRYVREAFSDLTKTQALTMTVYWMKNFKRN